ncbi:hypothetical protein P692DRAFT_20761315, partial [Suillus brevipes Sb2]
DSPLATNINHTVGQVPITIPNVETREDYIIVLFWGSGNASPTFTIINDSSSAPAPASTTSSQLASFRSGAYHVDPIFFCLIRPRNF